MERQSLHPQPLVGEEGRYLYCVADGGQGTSLGGIGLEGAEVYTIPYKDVCAVVDDCSALGRSSPDPEAVQAWVLAHQRVVDAAWSRWGTVLPLGFGTILGGEAGRASGKVRAWLEQEYPRLKEKLQRLKGKAEYGVQVFWEPRVVVQNITQTDPALSLLSAEIETASQGLAYMYRRRLADLIRRQTQAQAHQLFRDLYSRIESHAEAIQVEKTKKLGQGQQMIASLSCLVSEDRYPELGEELSRINQLEGFSVRFTGPWPPYSFVEGI